MPASIPGDWFDAALPQNVMIESGAHIETAYSFRRFYSIQAPGFVLGAHASVYRGCTFAVGVNGIVTIGEYSLLNGLYLHCEQSVRIGKRVLIAWSVGIFDTHGLPRSKYGREKMLEIASDDPSGRLPPETPSSPVVIEDDVWIGFGSVILPGVRIGAGSIVGAKSVVTRSLPPGVIAAGNPARVLRPVPGVVK